MSDRNRLHLMNVLLAEGTTAFQAAEALSLIPPAEMIHAEECEDAMEPGGICICDYLEEQALEFAREVRKDLGDR